MAWRGIHLTRPAYVSINNRVLALEFRDEQGGKFSQPIEDLAYLVLDNPAILLTGQTLAALAEANVLLLGVNAKHLPVWTSLPWTNFYRPGEVLDLQRRASQPLRKQLWAHIIRAKINAQAQCLQNNRRAGGEILRAMIAHVRSGDPDNIEARAARQYWSALFPDGGFIRHAEDFPNALLNYGYAILRSALACTLCAIGFIPAWGLHHASLANAYNLADDLIEPYRPLVDHHALAIIRQEGVQAEFAVTHRRALIQMMQAEFEHQGQRITTMEAIQQTAASLKNALARKEASLLCFPVFLPT